MPRDSLRISAIVPRHGFRLHRAIVLRNRIHFTANEPHKDLTMGAGPSTDR